MSNFLFLKKNNENLFNIMLEAEKLFRDEYFEQAVIQTRRFAENICRDLLQDNILIDETFDSMINRIKDNSFGNIRMKEFTEDLFFLKKHGNASAHSLSASKNGEIALACLERAYEISVFYSNLKYGYNKKLDKALFSEELLMTGKKSSSKLLTERYSNELKKSREKSVKSLSVTSLGTARGSRLRKKADKPTKTPQIKQKRTSKSENNKNKTLVVVIIFHIILIALCLFFYFNK